MTPDLDLVPTAMVAGGAALARDDDGRVVFVAGALPGERVRARVTGAKRDFARAVVVEVLEASPDRLLPPCPALAAGCGGCTWQHIAPEGQERLKAAIVVDSLRRIGRIRQPPSPVQVALTGPALRTTARLAVSPSGRAGHRPRAGAVSGDVTAVETDHCLTVHPLLDDLISVGRYPGAEEVLLRAGVALGDRLVRARAAADNVRVPPDVVVVGQGGRRSAFVREEVAGRQFRVSADSFFQPGPIVATGLVAAVGVAVGDALSTGGHLVDAYSGVGLFASVLGVERGARVTAIERDPSAVADARVNLADIESRVVPIEVGRWHPRRGDPPADVIIADPARPGLGRPGVAALCIAGAPRLVLVSCDPASLGRDVALLAAAGYTLSSVAVVDAFPHTFHIETVSRFDRTGATART